MDLFEKMKIIKALKNCEDKVDSNQVFNANQCKNLVHHLSNFVQRFQEIFELDTRAFQPLLKDACKVSSKVEMLVQSCSQTWSIAPLIQMKNKEVFRELLLEMASCLEGLFDIASNIDSCLKVMENIVDFQSCITNFLPCDLEEVKEDQDELCKILEKRLHTFQQTSYDHELVKYVLQWRDCILKVEDGESDLLQFLPNAPLPNFGDIPRCLERNVFLTKWLGIENVTKKIDVDGYDELDIIKLEKEVQILAQLNHPNVIKLFYCNSFKDPYGQNHLQFGMEKGEMDLHKMLFEDPNQRITYHTKLDIMQQIANGVLYLHDMKVAHRDLKPHNIVVNTMQCLELKEDGYVCAKLIDFGISKDEVKGLMLPSGIRGTRVYIAPEALKANMKIDPLKIDVYSFGLICCDILLQKECEDFGSTPFEISRRQKLALKGIPICQELRLLIEDCLSMDPNGRPSFAKIYTSLMDIKKKDFKAQCISKMSMGKNQTEYQALSYSNLCMQFSSSIEMIGKWWFYIWRLIVYYLWSFIIDYKWRLYTPKKNDKCIKDTIDSSTLQKCCGLDFKIKTLEKFLRNKSMVGVIGMSGIGKTTLVKALKDHLNKALPLTNDSSKWTTIMCDFQSDHLMEMNRILKELGQKQEVKDLIEGKLILTLMLQQKKVFFILDDVTDEHQLDMFLEAKMFSITGSKLIVTSRDWRILKGMINEDSKFEVPVLNYDQSMEIFSKHAFKSGCSKTPLMNQLSKKIVNACGGHPLSLEVMGSCLNGHKRLRVWEQALQRLKRGEYDALEDVGRRLEISFDMLRDEEQEVFLDISCFFCKDVWFEDIQEDTIVDYLNDNTKTIIASLRDKSLIKIDDNGFIHMHNLIRDMGRRISRKRFGGRRKWKQTSWSLESSKKEEFQNTRGICITTVNKEIDSNPIEVVELPELMLLNVEALNDLSNVAKLIKKTHQLKFLRIIYQSNDIDYGILFFNINQLTFLLQLQELWQLTVLELQNFQSMKTFPNTTIEHLPLKTLCLRNCHNLTNISHGFQNITSMTSLYIQRCSKLTSIHTNFENLKALEILDFEGCESLEYMPFGFNKLVFLKKMNFTNCKQLKIVDSELASLTSLTTLNFKGCGLLEEIPSAIANMSYLEWLGFGGCKKLRVGHVSFENLKALKILTFEGCEALENIPQGLGKLSSLKELYFNDCKQLKVVDLKLALSLGNLSSLTILKFDGCSRLETFPKEVGKLSSLTNLVRKDSSNLASLEKAKGDLSSLTTLDLEDCSSLSSLSKEVGNLSSITTPKSEEFSSKVGVQAIGVDEHLLKKQREEAVVSQLEAKYDLSKIFNNAIQEPLLKLLSFLTIKGVHILGSLLLWVQICIGMFGQQVLSWNKGKVKSKDLMIGRFLGQGCSGIFYETMWSQKSMVKLAKKDFPGVTSDTFEMEVVRLFELKDHPNIVKTFCWTVDNRSCSLVMEYMKDDLSSFMRKKKETLRKKSDQPKIEANPSPFHLFEALDILLQIAIGMEYLHDKGIYHGDLKPNNVFLDWKDGQMLVKVVDFGLHETKRSTTLLSRRALCFRMIEWSAPELFEDFFCSMKEDLDFLWTTSLASLDPSTSGASCFENGQKVDLEKADIYSFGLTSAYVLGGEQMWPAKLSPQELRKQISSYGLRPKLPSKCPKTLVSLISKCWDIDPTHRPTFSIIQNEMKKIIHEHREVGSN